MRLFTHHHNISNKYAVFKKKTFITNRITKTDKNTRKHNDKT